MQTHSFTIIQETFQQLLQEHPKGVTAQLVVNYQGERVIDLHGSAPHTAANTPETAYLTFSVSKGFTTIAILKLLDQGLLELDAPIARYWPAFGQKGKESATISGNPPGSQLSGSLSARNADCLSPGEFWFYPR